MNDDYNMLTEEEELQRLRAIRRRRAAREARRRKRRQEAIVRCSIFLVVVILLLIGIIKLLSAFIGLFTGGNDKKKEDDTTIAYATTQAVTTEATTTEMPTTEANLSVGKFPEDRTEALEILAEQAKEDEDLQTICDNEQNYPDMLLQCLASNSELKQYALDYPDMYAADYDGEFSVEVSTSEVPLFLQYDERWGYADYGTSFLGLSGCGPTCLSMVYTYLTQDGSMNPLKMGDFSMNQGYLTDDNDTSWQLMTDGATTLGLTSEELTLSETTLIEALKSGKLIICSMSAGDFTSNGHYIVIRDYEDGKFYVNDPNSKIRSEASWTFERLEGQISNLWAISKGTASSTTNNSNETSINTYNDDAEAVDTNNISSDDNSGISDSYNSDSDTYNSDTYNSDSSLYEETVTEASDDSSGW